MGCPGIAFPGHGKRRMALTPADRERLLTRLDAVCEQRASAADLAEIERLVLADADARWLYLTYLDLHGTLAWDAAGIGSADPMVTTALPSPRSRRAVGRSLSLVAALLLFGVLVGRYLLPATTQVARRDVPVPVTPELAEGPGPGHPTEPAGVPPAAKHRKPVELATQKIPTPERSGTIHPADAHSVRSEDAAPMRAEVVAATVAPREGADTPDLAGLDEVARIARRVDALLEATWRDYDVTPSPMADDATWLRRVTLDLAGRIPTVAEVDAFLKSSAGSSRDDAAREPPDRRRAVVDRLLADGDFVRHMTTTWSNLLIGRNPAPPVDRAAFQQHLRLAFAENRPWNVMVAELLSAEGRTDEQGATNYLVAHLNNQAVPATAITSRLFLGQQLHCAQCHNHPFNPYQQAAFWELNSLFQQTEVLTGDAVRRAFPQMEAREARRGPAVAALVTQAEGGPIYYETTNGLMKVAFPRFNGQDVDPAPEVNRRQALANLLKTRDQPQLAAAFVNRLWAQFLGAGFTSPIDDMGPHNPPCHPEVLGLLEREFRASGYDVRALIRWITATDAYRRSSETTEGNRGDDPVTAGLPLFSRVYPKPMTAEQLYDSLLTATRADQVGVTDWTAAETNRQAWLDEFVVSLENDENSEAETLSGTYGQALTLMNGDVMQAALALEAGSFLGETVRAKLPEGEKLRRLWVAALSREPSARELAGIQKALRDARGPQTPRPVGAGYQDLFWALLNSNEFAIVH